ncbi:MAG: hypothetical protein JNL24_04775 [Bacteroidia bacterium]|nr:hypothetical protein [Bacteroidia bacterium]
MKKYFWFIAVSCFALLLTACSSGNENDGKGDNKDSVIAQKEDFKKAEVLDQITIKLKPAESYALYVPSTYDPAKKYPVILAFDPHADGSLPVSQYKELAERYGYIIAGSNVSKNGISWEDSKFIVNNLYTDVLQRLSVDSQRVYMMGFSGGARIANGATIVHSGIAGVICAGAAYPAVNSEHPRNDYVFLGVVGMDDFNYTEMRKYDLVDLAGHNLKHSLITYNGKHEWPPVEVMNEGFLYFEFQNMRRDLKKKNDALVNQYYQAKLKELDSLMNGKHSYAAYQLCRRTINFYDALVDLKPFYDAYNLLKANKDVDQALQQSEKQMQDEDKLKQQYLQYFQTKDISWWQKEVKILSQKAQNSKDDFEKHSSARILSYLSLIAYIQTNGALAQNNVLAAEQMVKVYLVVDPSNNEAHYLNAIVAVKSNKVKEVYSSLNKSIELGFNDKGRLENESSFVSLKAEKEFQEILQKLK